MDREIKFRAKLYEENRWVYGGGAISKEGYEYALMIAFDDQRMPVCHRVYKETLGEFTGLKDKNGKKIYEGDILKEPDSWDERRTVLGEVKFLDGSFVCDHHDGTETCYSFMLRTGKTEVMGNIHENSELMEKAKQ